MKVIKLTKLEAEALLDTSGQMADDMDYYSYMGKAEHKKYITAYNSAREKLRQVAFPNPKTTEQ